MNLQVTIFYELLQLLMTNSPCVKCYTCRRYEREDALVLMLTWNQ